MSNLARWFLKQGRLNESIKYWDLAILEDKTYVKCKCPSLIDLAYINKGESLAMIAEENQDLASIKESKK